jgi:hypothetical protein
MNKATEEMFNDMLSTAKSLVEAPNNVNWIRYMTVQFPAQIIDEVRQLLKPFGFRSISKFYIASVRNKVKELTKILYQIKIPL